MKKLILGTIAATLLCSGCNYSMVIETAGSYYTRMKNEYIDAKEAYVEARDEGKLIYKEARDEGRLIYNELTQEWYIIEEDHEDD